VRPAAAYQILAVQTKRLCAPGGNTVENRRIVCKLAFHFSTFVNPYARVKAEVQSCLLYNSPPETYALDILAVIAQANNEETQ
jgi:hypothetical protein